MALYSISDLHLPLGVDKPMDVFGGRWTNYVERIRENWLATVEADDYVVMPGDFCWAMKLSDSKKDFEYLDALPGKKILLKGNHDYWWDTVSKLNKFIGENYFSNIHFLQNNVFEYKDAAICGTRFWVCPGNTPFTEEDKKIYLRELGRAELSLRAAAKLNPKQILFFTHYPPIRNENEPDAGFMEIMKRYNVSKVIYGHLHGDSCNTAFVGEKDGISYDLVSCDYMQFMPLKLLD